MEFFGKTNINFLGKMWYFIALSLIFSVSGVCSMLFWHHIPLSVDFRGGTVVRVKFAQTPSMNDLRSRLDKAGLHNPILQSYQENAGGNEVMIKLDLKDTGTDLNQGKALIVNALRGPNTGSSQQDLNNIGYFSLQDYLVRQDPLHAGAGSDQQYQQMAHAIIDYRDQKKGGILTSVGDVASVVPPAVLQQLQGDFMVSNFEVRNVDIVGPQVGDQLRKQALWATLGSLLGMLVYLAFRFETIYGIAAVVACFHDTLITVGMFSILNVEISLTVIAAILTLVGYSMNDTIVVFDRIRENLKAMRRESLWDVVNLSINQTLSRTVLTSGLTFLTVLSLYIFGGEVLHGFSLALVIGIIIGTYSSIFIAAPILVAYQDWRAKRTGGTASLPAARKAKA